MYWANNIWFPQQNDWMHTLQKEVNRIFNAYERGVESGPAVNVWSNNEAVVVTAEMPGIDPKELEVNVQGDLLTLQGERKMAAQGDKWICHRQERTSGAFRRVIRLPYAVEADKVSARYEKGILEVTLPRVESSKPRKIKVAV